MDGVLLVDKPAGMTSHDVVDALRQLTGMRRIGHAGSLDPHATGVLLLLLGKATRISRWLMELDKEYVFTIQLGLETRTHDRWGEIVAHSDIDGIPEERVVNVLMSFEGKYHQIAPAVSALKHEGRPLYKIAREGGRVPIKARIVSIRRIEILDVFLPFVTAQLECSSGTYVRAIARDIGHKLGCGATVFCLRRTRVGDFTAQNALTLGVLASKQSEIDKALIPIDEALGHLPKLRLRKGVARSVRQGKQPDKDGFIEAVHFPLGSFRLADSDGSLVGIARREACGGFHIKVERIL